MKTLSRDLFLLVFSMTSCILEAIHPFSFRIVVPSYNNERYTRRCIESLMKQKIAVPYSIIAINDCSTDKTGTILEQIKQEHQLSDEFFMIVHNSKRVGALANIYTTVHERCKNNEVIVLVDGDDALAHQHVLQRIAQEYNDPDILMTYGQFVFYPSGAWGTTYEIPREALEKKEVRKLPYVAQHVRTFRRELFVKIKKNDLMKDGTFLSMAGDVATMIPMLEMCAPLKPQGKVRCVFIPDILLIYTYNNPLNDHSINRSLQVELEQYVKSLKPYNPVSAVKDRE